MYCLMCSSSDDRLQMFQGDIENDTFKKIIFVLPDFSVPESEDPVFICATCLNQVLIFYTIKKESLENSSLLKYFNAMLKGTNNIKSSEVQVVINSDKVSIHSKKLFEFKINPNSKYLLSEDHDPTNIKKENDHCSQHLVNVELSMNYLQDDESGSSSDDSKQNHKDIHTKKITKKDPSKRKTQGGSQKKRFKCSECHKAFTWPSNLEIHSRVHTGEKPFKCRTCQKTFTQLGHLNIHQLTHTDEKPHECDVCHKTFSQKRYLIYHKRVHNNVRPFQCAVCNKGFTQSNDLTTHMRTHTGEKPHHCHLCEYKCTQAGNLKTHIRRHTGEKPYSCKHCDKSFTTSSDLKRHEYRHHSKEDSD